MTFAVSSTNVSGAIGGVNQSIKPNLDTDNGFDRILDSRVEKTIDQNRRNNSQKTTDKPVYEFKSKENNMKRPASELSKSDEVTSKDQKQVNKSSDDRIVRLKKLAKEIKEGEGLDEKEIKELKDQLVTLVESLLSTETELTDEQITELSAFLGELSEVLTAVEGKLEIVLSELQLSNDKFSNDTGSNDT
ncbi:MAG: hypothetical protein WBA54_13925, partial [Acidaminobacteraceae bacterium]